MEMFLGQIALFAFGFAPRGWQRCDGQILNISQYQALFALLGTNFGGDGRNNFAIPKIDPIKVGNTPVYYYILVEDGVFPVRDCTTIASG